MRVPAPLIRCAASSLAAVAIEFILLTFFVSVLHMHYLVAAVASTAVYLLVTFLLNRRWAFSASGGAPVARQLAKHLGVAGVGLGLALVQMRFFINTVGMPYQLGWAAAGCVNFGAWTWPMSRFFTYRAARVVPCPVDAA